MANTRNLVFSIAMISAVHLEMSHASTAKELLSESLTYFDKGQYKRALDVISPLDIRTDFDNSDDMKLAFKIRSVAYEQTGDTKKAKETIRELFFLDPEYKFDPFDTPKSVVAIAKDEKVAIDEKNKQLATIKTAALLQDENKEALSAVADAKPPILIDSRPQAITTLFPFGVNHYYLSSHLKGGIYLSLQSIGLITNIAAFWWKQSYLLGYGVSRLQDQEFSGRFETAQMIQYIGLSVFIVSYGISVLDAVIRFRRDNAPT